MCSLIFPCREKKILEAKASANSTRIIGAASAVAVESLGAAEAEGVVARAEAFSHFTDASKLSSTLKALPTIAAHVAQPLADTREIVLLSDNCSITAGIDEYMETAKTLLGGVLPANVIGQMSTVRVSELPRIIGIQSLSAFKSQRTA